MRKAVINKVLLPLSVIPMAAAISSCSCEACLKNESLKIPIEVLEKSNAFIESKVGLDFFKENILLDYERCQADSPYYEMHYRLRMKNKDYVDEDIHFTVGQDGRIVFEKEITGLPECLDQPETCRFNIDKEEAIKIAGLKGLKKGIRDWDISFRWEETSGQYVWHILSTLFDGVSSEGKRTGGEEILIDPSDGSVIRKSEWVIK